MSGPAPLDGATVLEISSFVAAPLGGLTLAQLRRGHDPDRPGRRKGGPKPMAIGPVGDEPVLDQIEQVQAIGDP
jgi:hypothetical protein